MQLDVSTSWKYKSYLKLKILKGNAQLVHRIENSKCFGGVVCTLVVNQNFRLIFIVKDFILYGYLFFPDEQCMVFISGGKEGKIFFFS